MRIVTLLILLAALVLLAAACSDMDIAGDPADTVEQYITAKVAADGETIASLLCSDLEGNLQRESNSFASVEATVEGLSCSRVGDSNMVACEGQIVATYGTEDRTFELATYNVVQEDGEWRWCGEAEASE